MKRDAIITVRGEQYFEGVDPDETELVTEGTFERTADGWRVVYDETELTGMAGTRTTVELREHSVLLTRTGTVTSVMAFEVGMPHTSLYETPVGALQVTLRTDSVRVRMSEHGGVAEARYAVTAEQQPIGNNRFRLFVKTKGRG